MDINRGMRDKLEKYVNLGAPIDAEMSISGPGEYDFTCFGVDADDKLSDDRYMVFYNQVNSPQNEISYSKNGNVATFKVNLNALPASIQKLVFTVSIDGNSTMGNISNFTFAVNQNGANAISLKLSGTDFSQEKAIIAIEIYRKDSWRFNAVARGFNGGLSDLLRNYGGEEDSQGASAPAAPAQPAGPAGPSNFGQPAAPAQPAQPAAPAGPAGPSNFGQPAAPAQPTQPAAPAGPAGPSNFGQPAAPAQSAQPAASPAGPQGPTGPSNFGQPAAPAQPAAQPAASPAGPTGPQGPGNFNQTNMNPYSGAPGAPSPAPAGPTGPQGPGNFNQTNMNPYSGAPGNSNPAPAGPQGPTGPQGPGNFNQGNPGGPVGPGNFNQGPVGQGGPAGPGGFGQAAAAAAPAQKTEKVSLAKGQKVSLTKRANSNDPIIVECGWEAFGKDYDLKALVRYRDGRQIYIGAANKDEALSTPDGAVRHGGDIKNPGELEHIFIKWDPNIASVAVSSYSAIENGTGSFRKYGVYVRIRNGNQTIEIPARDASADDRSYTLCFGEIVYGQQPDSLEAVALEMYSAPNSEHRIGYQNGKVVMDIGPTGSTK